MEKLTPLSPTSDFECGPTSASRSRQPLHALRLDKSSQSTSGFSLIETLVALTILAVGVLGVAAGLLSAISVSTNSREKTEAIYIAEQQLEFFRSMTISEIVALAGEGTGVVGNNGNGGSSSDGEGEGSSPDGFNSGGGGYVASSMVGSDDYDSESSSSESESSSSSSEHRERVTAFTQNWKIELNKPVTDVITVTVSVGWTDKRGVSRSTQLTTYRAN